MSLRRSLFILLVLISAAGAPLAQESSTPGTTAEELIEREQARRAVEDAFSRFNELSGRPGELGDIMAGGANDLMAAGPGVVPFLVAELDQESPGTFGFCAYVLGLIGGPEAEAALRAAMKKADMADGDWAFARKGWAAYGLGLMGVAEAVELVDAGRHSAGSLPVHERMNALEAIALQTAPESVPLLLRRLEARGEPKKIRRERILVVQALRRVADPAAVPKLLELAGTDDLYVRNEVLHALARIGTPDALKAVWTVLDDENVKLRTIAVTALERQAADVSLDLLQQKLNDETSPGVRGAIYRMLARRGGASMTAVLVKQWGHPDSVDRHQLVRALAALGSAEALPVLRQALDDPDGSVRTRATKALGTIGDEQAVKLLLSSLRSPDFQVVRSAAKALSELGVEGAGAAIAARLFEVELAGVMRDVRLRSHAAALAVNLVDLRYHQALDRLKEATARQVDLKLIESLQPIIEQLEAIRTAGDDLERWIELTEAEQAHIRSLAYSRLGELGGAEAAATLGRVFGRVDPGEGTEILRAAGMIHEEPTLALIERVLSSEAFDRNDRVVLRTEAAWGARRIGGRRMQRALQRAVERRDGRDAKIMVYLALVAGKEALPLFQRYRIPRLRYMSWKAGVEMEQLDRIAVWIDRGWSLRSVDVPPERLTFD